VPRGLRIGNIKVEGFRGINKKLILSPNGKPVFLFGENGAGKTSLLQAIEWCMFGELSYLPAEEYRMEDALVNSFHAEKTASVELSFKDEKGRTIKLSRTRKMGKSTTRGKNPLELEIDGKKYEDGEAENRLATLLELTPEEYYCKTHLHQETVRDLLVGQIADRSAMIDKMLGLYRLRQLTESLPVSSVDREIKDMRGDIQDTEEQKEIYKKTLTRSREDLNRYVQELENAEVKADSVSIVSLAEIFTKSYTALSDLASILGLALREIKAPKTVDEAKGIPDGINRELTQLENKRTEIYGSLNQDLARANASRTQYEESLEELSRLKVDVKRIETETSEVETKLSKLKEEEKIVKNIVIHLASEETVAKRLQTEWTGYKSRIDGIIAKYGDRAAIEKSIGEIDEKILSTTKLITQQGIVGNLLDLGNQLFQTTIVEVCPLCESRIEHEKVQQTLQRRVRERKEAKLIEELRSTLAILNSRMDEHKEATNNLDDLLAKLDFNRKELEARKKEIEKLGLDAKQLETPDQLHSFVATHLKSGEAKLEDLGGEIEEVTKRKLEIEGLSAKINRLEQTEKSIQELIHAKATGDELLKKLDDYTASIQTRADEIAKLGEKATGIRDMTTLMRAMVEYLSKKGEIERMEKTMLPGIQAKLEALNKKVSKMEELGAAIHDIHDAAIVTQEDFVRTTLESLQKDINRFYSKLVPHPHFEKLRLEPEVSKGKYLYRIRAMSQDGKDLTYVQTRFGVGHQNLAAISLFLAMGSRAPAGFVVFDDPSQSLDPDHRRALASLIEEISEEQQVFVATQDEEFQEQLRPVATKLKAHVLTLGKWSVEGTKIRK